MQSALMNPPSALPRVARLKVTLTTSRLICSVDSRVLILPSAGRHGIDPEDALHAIRNAIRIWALDEKFYLYVGPDSTGDLIEVGVVIDPPTRLVVHAMRARRKYLSRK